MSLIKQYQQREISEQRRMPVDGVASDAITDISGETLQLYYYNSGVLTIDAGQVAGVVVVGKLANRNIKNALGDVIGQFNDTSVAFTTGTVLTTLVQFPYLVAETADTNTGTLKAQAITEDFANGEYCIDHRTGTIYGKKATTGVSDTVAYKVEIAVSGGGGGIASDVNVNKVGGTAVPTFGSTPVVPSAIYDDAGNQITSFGSPSTIAEYKSPSDFTATYTSTITITLSGLSGFSITDSSQIVYIRVIPATGDAEVYTNGSSGVTMTVSSNVLTIAGAGTPFTSGDVYEVGINALDYTKDPSSQTIKTTVNNPENSHYTDAEPLVTASDIGASDGVYIDQGAEISMEEYTKLGMFVKFTVNDSETNTIKVLSKHAGAGAEEFVLETSAEYIKTLGDANINIYYEFDTSGTIPYLQVQSAAADVDTGGGTEGTLEIYIVKK